MCKHALTRLPLISPWAALTSVFWVSDKAVLVLSCFSPTKYWTDLKVAISLFIIHVYSTTERNLQQLASSHSFTVYMSVESVIWSCLWFFGTGYLELCVPCLYRLWLWTKLPLWWIILRKPQFLSDVFICTGLNWERDLRRFKLHGSKHGQKQWSDPWIPPPLHCFMNSKLFISS